MFSGLGFAYFGHSYVLHGIFILAMTLYLPCRLYCGHCPLAVAEGIPPGESRLRAHERWGGLGARAAFFTTALTTLLSSLFGAIPGANFGNGIQIFLAENV
jgi:hypothetical protein